MRGVASGVGVALPVVGGSALTTAGLIALGGPGSFMAEQALTREDSTMPGEVAAWCESQSIPLVPDLLTQ